MAGVKSVPFTAMTMRWPKLGAVSRQVEDVVPEQGFAAGEDDHHLAHGGQVVQELFALLGGQLTGIRPGPRRGPAVEAGQVAAPGGLPGQEAEGRDFIQIYVENDS